MLLKYTPFFYRYGVRKPDQLARPPLGRLENFDLPQNSVYHYLGVNEVDEGPVETLRPLLNYAKQFPTKQILEAPMLMGQPRRLPINAEQQFVRPWRLKHLRFRPFVDFEIADRDPMQLVVFNYAYLPRMYRYMRSFYTTFHKLYNHQAALWDQLKDAVTQTERHHFIELAVPQQLPSVSILRNVETGITRKAVPFFTTIESVIILELWRWLGPMREQSLISKIPRERLNKINIVFTDAGRWMVLNLGLLDGWRLPSRAEQETFEQEGLTLKGRMIKPDIFQRRLLYILMLQTQARVEDVPENLSEDDPSTPVKEVNLSAKPAEQVQESGVTRINTPDQLPAQLPSSALKINQKQKSQKENDALTEFPKTPQEPEFLSQAADITAETVGDISAGNYEQVLADLDRLEAITNLTPEPLDEEQPQEDEDPTILIPKPKTHIEAIQQLCEQLAETGAMPVMEFKRTVDQAEAFSRLPAPDGSKLGEFIQIAPEKVKIAEPARIQDQSTITDKSMLQSSLLEFDKRYVQDVMQRDVAGMVANLQQAGILVLDYKVEEIEDITGSYFAYKVRVKPIQGAPSTLTFNLPKVNPNGTYRVNGVTYHTRKQRGDLPIRKIKPNRVALTSYYGKVFVDRSDKKVNDYGRWLREHIMRMGLDPESDTITDMRPGSIFDHEAKTPRLYGILAQGFRSLNLLVQETNRATRWQLNFDYDKRSELLAAPNLLSVYERDGVVVGRNAVGDILTIGSDNQLYEFATVKGQLVKRQLPEIEDILDLRGIKTPIDQVDISLYGKSIPSGVVLGYLMGLDKLCKRLGVKPRVVPPGQRLGLQVDEWAIVFQDESWVFSRKDALATMVLAGWRDFDQTTRQYSAAEFNRKNVYLNLLEENGLGVRHLREITLIDQLFIDPITRELLAEMGEPQVMTELFLRSAEMLLTEDHPHELDARYMRIKGYERFSGILYSELVRSVRSQRARPNRKDHPMEMNPYAVWISISEDSAKNQVSEINPIMDLKVSEAVTYAGHGGRMSRSMVKRTRAYHPSDMGTISEATVDASDVAINVSLSANPQLTSLRGTTASFDLENPSTTSLFSTSALLAPSADKDD